MALTIHNNTAAMNAYRNLSSTQNSMNSSLEKLSSGFRINRAADDAAGLAISEGLRSQIGGLTVAARNAQDGISVVQTAEGALTEVHAILQRVRDLAVQGANDSNSEDARTNIETEIKSLGAELTRITDSTNFNGTSLLNSDKTLTFQVGAGSDSNSAIEVDLADIGAIVSGIAALSVTDHATAQSSIADIDTAIAAISTQRSELGAYQNRLDHTINSINVTMENLTASESRIRDTDMANEMVNFTSAQILSQAGTTMLAQAKNIPQSVLSLLQG